MEEVKLGLTHIKVSRLGLGTLAFGPLQKNLPIENGAQIIKTAVEKGLSFIDTAQIYRTYPCIKEALKETRGKIAVSTKTNATSYRNAERDVSSALKNLARDYIDIFSVHAEREESPFKERREAFRCLMHFKKKGIIKAVGISTHRIKVVKECISNGDVDIVNTIINLNGIGIIDGSRDEMADAIAAVHEHGKGVCVMKVLGGGTLIDNAYEAIAFVKQISSIDVIMLGVANEAELLVDIDIFNNKKPEQIFKKNKRIIIVKILCIGCAQCLKKCPNGAISMVDKKPDVATDKCMLCGYCVSVCPQFCIRIV